MSSGSTGSFAAALEERRRIERKRSLIRWGVIVGVVLVIGFAVWLVTLSPVFRVHDVTIRGATLLTAEEVRDAATVAENTSMLTLDTEGVAARVSALPEVREVEVSRELPDTVVIEVTERTAVFQRVEGNVFEWVDEEGVIFSTSSTPIEDVLEAVTSSKESRVLADVGTVVANIPSSLMPRVQRVQASAVDRITLQLDEGDLVVWGSAEDSELKADVLEALISVDAQLYDISAPSHPTTK